MPKSARSCGREAASDCMCVLDGETNGFVFGRRIAFSTDARIQCRSDAPKHSFLYSVPNPHLFQIRETTDGAIVRYNPGHLSTFYIK